MPIDYSKRQPTKGFRHKTSQLLGEPLGRLLEIINDVPEVINDKLVKIPGRLLGEALEGLEGLKASEVREALKAVTAKVLQITEELLKVTNEMAKYIGPSALDWMVAVTMTNDVDDAGPNVPEPLEVDESLFLVLLAAKLIDTGREILLQISAA